MSLKVKISIFLTAILVTTSSISAEYPDKSIRLVIPFGAGGGTDAVGRALADSARDILKTDILIMNRTGGSGALGMSYGATQRGDGYTLTMITREIVSLPQMGLMKIDASDFKLIRMINLDPAVVLVRADSELNTIKDLIYAAKTYDRKLEFASTAAPNIYLMALEKDQNIKLDAIPYNGSAQAIPALLKQHADVTMVTPGEAITLITAGRLKALGVMSEKRLASMPTIPTLKEQGVDVTSGTWRGIAAPINTPDPIIEKLGAAFDQAMASEQFKSRMQQGAMTIHSMNAKEFTSFVKQDAKELSALID
jgi:tripartite-type tricarboxylate transporter receptor subunit TctC